MSEQYMAGDVFRQQRDRDIYAARAAVVEAAKKLEGAQHWQGEDELSELCEAARRLRELEGEG